MKFKLLTIIGLLIAFNVNADTPSGSEWKDTVQNTAAGLLSGVVNVVNEDAANTIKNYANQPDSTATATGQVIGSGITYVGVGGGAVAYSAARVAASVDKAMEAVTLAANANKRAANLAPFLGK